MPGAGSSLTRTLPNGASALATASQYSCITTASAPGGTWAPAAIDLANGTSVLYFAARQFGWRSRSSSMHPLRLTIDCAWVVFWIYWIASASTSKESVSSGWRTRLTGVSAVGILTTLATCAAEVPSTPEAPAKTAV